MGTPYMPWQTQVVNTALEVGPDRRLKYPLIVVTVPRQSGKTTLLAAVFAHAMLTRSRARCWLTAQKREDARDTWGELSTLIEASPVQEITRRRNANGQEQLSVPLLGSTLRPFHAGDERALHGKQSDKVLCDEAFAFTREQGRAILQAVVPTQATRPDAQTWIVSTAGTAASTWLWDYVRDARERLATPGGDTGRMAFFEWGIPADTEDLTDLDVYEAHHPALGHTIGREALETAAELLSPAEFARAYGNFWTQTESWAVAPALWDGARTAVPLDMTGPLSFAAEVSADRKSAVIVVAGQRSDGRGHAVEIVDFRTGIAWVAPRILELAERWNPAAVVVDSGSPAGTVYRKLSEQRDIRLPLPDVTAGTLVDAQTEFLDGLVSGAYAHRSNKRLDAAVRAATTRLLRETSVFSRLVAEDGTTPAPLLAAMLAFYGLSHPPATLPAELFAAP
ncbi:phage terminase large subunit family protein [Streptomyces synnematoformans]